MQLNRILVPVSGSGVDEEALKIACSLAKRSKAEIYVVYIIQVKRSLPLDAELDWELKKAEEVLTRADDIAAEQDCEVGTDLLQAREAGPAIVDEAVEKGVDLILMGVDYKKRFGLFNLGVAVPYVLKEAPCRVLLYREPIE